MAPVHRGDHDLLASWGRRRTAAVAAGLFVCVLGCGLLLARPAPESYDAQVMLQVAQSMVDRGDFRVTDDGFGMNSPYASYGIGMSALMAPPYWAATRLGREPGPWVMSVDAVLTAGIAVVLLLLGAALDAGAGLALGVALTTVAGTLLLPYVATGFSEPGVALGVALGLLGIAAGRPGLAGAGAGLALLMRVDSALLVVPPLAAAAWLGARRSGARTRAAAAFAVGLLPALLVTAAYDTVRFGEPWRFGYAQQPFNHPLLAGLYGLLLSPAAGLLVYVPLTPVALAGLRAAWRRAPVVAACALALLAVRLPFYATWWSWSAYWAWGPRFLVPAMPVLAVGLVEVYRRWPGRGPPLRALVVSAVTLSVAVQVVGATIRYESAGMFAAMLRAHPGVAGPGFLADASRPATEAALDRVEFDWRRLPVADEALELLHGRQLASRWARRPVAAGAVAALLLAAAAGLAGAALAAARRVG